MRDIYPGDHSSEPSYGEALLARVETVEALPHSEAFEQLMYDHRARRSAYHAMDTPLTIPDRFLQADIPEEVRACLPATRPVIEHLAISQTELIDVPATLEISFTSRDCRHVLVTQDEQTRYRVENIDGDTNDYAFDSDIGSKLLASLLYVRLQTHDSVSPADNAPITYSTSTLELPRPTIVSEREMFIRALGDFDGESGVETVSTFQTGDKVLAAKLAEIERPTVSGLQSTLELSQVDDLTDISTLFDDKPHTDLHQNFASNTLVGIPADLAIRYAEQHIDGESHHIDPKGDFAKWAQTCDEFLTVIEDEIDRSDDAAR